MTKPRYATDAERKAALSEQARTQMLAQWALQRKETGQGLGYYGCHRRVRTRRGRARDHACEHCGAQARHWAHIHGTDPADSQNYVPLCQSCHWRYDDVGARIAEVMGPARRSDAATLAWSRRSPGQRQAIIRKAWATRRGNRASPDRSLAGPG